MFDEKVKSMVHTFICSIELSLLPRHEEVNNMQGTIVVDCHVNSRLLECCWRSSAVDWYTTELRRIAVASSEVHGTFVITGETAT
jgi:hypothetical protein